MVAIGFTRILAMLAPSNPIGAHQLNVNKQEQTTLKYSLSLTYLGIINPVPRHSRLGGERL